MGDEENASEASEASPASASAGEGDGEADTDLEEVEDFDITLPTTHSYMGAELQRVAGRAVLEAGWKAQIIALAHSGAVFPGETVPLHIPDPTDATRMREVLNSDRLFALLFPDASGLLASGLGVLCEVFEAASETPALSVKAKAIHRVKAPAVEGKPLFLFASMSPTVVEVLPETCLQWGLHQVRLPSLDPWRHSSAGDRIQRLESSLTAWPAFVLAAGDYTLLRKRVMDYFSKFTTVQPPSSPTELSFWVCANLWSRQSERLCLLQCADATTRLHLALRLLEARGEVVCVRCDSEVARLEDVFTMSSDGPHGNYTNIGGYVHDIVTVTSLHSEAARVTGAPSAQFSWFPSYTWRVLLCVNCRAHLGWRFDALKKNLRPQRFYGLSRNSVQPKLADSETSEL